MLIIKKIYVYNDCYDSWHFAGVDRKPQGLIKKPQAPCSRRGPFLYKEINNELDIPKSLLRNDLRRDASRHKYLIINNLHINLLAENSFLVNTYYQKKIMKINEKKYCAAFKMWYSVTCKQ